MTQGSCWFKGRAREKYIPRLAVSYLSAELLSDWY